MLAAVVRLEVASISIVELLGLVAAPGLVADPELFGSRRTEYVGEPITQPVGIDRTTSVAGVPVP